VKVREHLAINRINTDAVLTSNGVDGVLTLTADGTFAPDSKIIVDMTRLQSDQSLRDRWIQLLGIETNKFKTATFAPRKATGLPSPLPASGEWTFTMDGQLTVYGVTKAASWSATATRAGRHLSGSATTLTQWADFDVEKPQAAVTQVVSVSDDTGSSSISWGRRRIRPSGRPNYFADFGCGRSRMRTISLAAYTRPYFRPVISSNMPRASRSAMLERAESGVTFNLSATAVAVTYMFVNSKSTSR
jgi:polyisoprenoid-binding protein YceI